MKIICFDIGKTKILASVVKAGRFGCKFLEINEQKNPHNPKKIEKMLLDYCLSVRKKYWTKKVAVSAAHLVDPEGKKVRQGKACYGADVFDFGFLTQPGFSVQIENDGRCFALGEYRFGRGKGASNVLSLALGTEIGGGFVLDGQSYRGFHNSAMEVSHMISSRCGKWQDWGALCAGKGIENLYRKKTNKKIIAQDIFAKAKENDKAAKEAVEEAAHLLGTGTASLVNLLDPEIIIFGGSLSKQKGFIEKSIKIARKNFFNKKANYKFAISSLGNKANLLGAASLYL